MKTTLGNRKKKNEETIKILETSNIPSRGRKSPRNKIVRHLNLKLILKLTFTKIFLKCWKFSLYKDGDIRVFSLVQGQVNTGNSSSSYKSCMYI